MTARSKEPSDLVGRALHAWQSEWPGLDLSPVSVIARLARAMSLLEPELEAALQRDGLNRASFDTLSALRRCGPPYQLSASQLADSCMRTSSTLTARIARLADAGLVTREPDPRDARSVLVTLTPRGVEVMDSAVPSYLATEELLLAALDNGQRDSLADLLRVLLLSLEGPGNNSAGSAQPVPALGVHLEPVHIALRKRRSVALPDRIGLLVSTIATSGPAARGGLLIGDLVTGIGGTAYRTIPELNHALSRRKPGRISVAVVRGTVERKVELVLPATRPVAAVTD